jgi:hypothetical protein
MVFVCVAPWIPLATDRFYSPKASADSYCPGKLRQIPKASIGRSVNVSLICVAAWTRFTKILRPLGLSICRHVWHCMPTWSSYAAEAQREAESESAAIECAL